MGIFSPRGFGVFDGSGHRFGPIFSDSRVPGDSDRLGRWKINQVALVVHAAYNRLRMGRLEALAQAA